MRSTSTVTIEREAAPAESSEMSKLPLASELEHCLADGIRVGRFPAQWTCHDLHIYLIGRIIVHLQSMTGCAPDPIA